MSHVFEMAPWVIEPPLALGWQMEIPLNYRRKISGVAPNHRVLGEEFVNIEALGDQTSLTRCGNRIMC